MPPSNRRPPAKLRTPQARVLSVLLPRDPSSFWTEWPALTGRVIARRLGTSEVSDLVRRACRGLLPGSSSGTPHAGLIALGLVEEYTLDVDGVDETYYRITKAGISALAAHLAANGPLSSPKERAMCVNDRYKSPEVAPELSL